MANSTLWAAPQALGIPCASMASSSHSGYVRRPGHTCASATQGPGPPAGLICPIPAALVARCKSPGRRPGKSSAPSAPATGGHAYGRGHHAYLVAAPSTISAERDCSEGEGGQKNATSQANATRCADLLAKKDHPFKGPVAAHRPTGHATPWWPYSTT